MPIKKTSAIQRVGSRTTIGAGTRTRSGRNQLQDDQKQLTRQNLLTAALSAFAEFSYTATTIDDIARRASVSRTSFYRHFESKLAIAEELLKEFSVVVRQHFDALHEYKHVNELNITSWILDRLSIYRDHFSVIQMAYEMTATEPDHYYQMIKNEEAVMLRLAEKIPAFQRAVNASEKDELQIRAYLLLFQFDQFCYSAAIRKVINPETGARIMAQQFLRFIDDVDTPSRRKSGTT